LGRLTTKLTKVFRLLGSAETAVHSRQYQLGCRRLREAAAVLQAFISALDDGGAIRHLTPEVRSALTAEAQGIVGDILRVRDFVKTIERAECQKQGGHGKICEFPHQD